MAGLLNADGQELNSNGKFRVTADKVITVVVTALLTYAAMSARVAVLESRQESTEQRLERMETKIDMLLQRP